MGVMKTVMYSIYTLNPLRVEIPKLSTYTHHLSKGIPMLVLYLFYNIYNEDLTKKIKECQEENGHLMVFCVQHSHLGLYSK